MNRADSLKHMENQDIWYDPSCKLYWRGELTSKHWVTPQRMLKQFLRLNYGLPRALEMMLWCIQYRSKQIITKEKLVTYKKSVIIS